MHPFISRPPTSTMSTHYTRIFLHSLSLDFHRSIRRRPLVVVDADVVDAGGKLTDVERQAASSLGHLDPLRRHQAATGGVEQVDLQAERAGRLDRQVDAIA